MSNLKLFSMLALTLMSTNVQSAADDKKDDKKPKKEEPKKEDKKDDKAAPTGAKPDAPKPGAQGATASGLKPTLSPADAAFRRFMSMKLGDSKKDAAGYADKYCKKLDLITTFLPSVKDWATAVNGSGSKATLDQQKQFTDAAPKITQDAIDKAKAAIQAKTPDFTFADNLRGAVVTCHRMYEQATGARIANDVGRTPPKSMPGKDDKKPADDKGAKKDDDKSKKPAGK